MHLFSRKTSLEDAAAFQGFTDWHCHILPGVDDGFRTIEESLEALAEYERLGVRNVWLTPHIMEDFPNETAALRARFEELKEAYRGPLQLNLAAEYMIDNLFMERFERGDLLTIGAAGRHVLVETSYISAPLRFEHTLREIMTRGLTPILAHPERYVYMTREHYDRFLSIGVLFQMNLFSILGCYGDSTRKRAKTLLKMTRPADSRPAELPLPAVIPAPSPSSEFSEPSEPAPAFHVTGAPAIALTGTDIHSVRQFRHYARKPDLSKSDLSTLPRLL